MAINESLTDPQLLVCHSSTVIPVISILAISIFLIFALVYLILSSAKVKKFWAIWWVSLLLSSALYMFFYLSPVATQTLIKVFVKG